MGIWELEGAGLPFSNGLRDADFTVSFPEGYGNWAVMLFTTPFEVRYQGRLHRGQRGDMLINHPRTPMWHRGIGGCYQNYWLHIYDTPALSESLGRYALMLDLPFTPRGNYAALFREIHWESIERPPYYRESISRKIQDLFLSLHRERIPGEAGKEQADWERRRDFDRLRRRMSRDLGKTWTVSAMAEALSLSPSRFSFLYKDYYGITPLGDLNSFRLEYAKQLLSHPAVSVKQAALESGFRDMPWFCRYFKRETGITPGRWRETRYRR